MGYLSFVQQTLLMIDWPVASRDTFTYIQARRYIVARGNHECHDPENLCIAFRDCAVKDTAS